MTDDKRRPTSGDHPGVGRAPSVSRLWPETSGGTLESVFDGTNHDDRRAARELAADVKHYLGRLFGHH